LIMCGGIRFRSSLRAIPLVLELGGLVRQHTYGTQVLHVLLPSILVQTDAYAGLPLQMLGQKLKGLRIPFPLHRWEGETINQWDF